MQNHHQPPPPYFPLPPPVPPLPPGWEEAVDPVSSRTYYANRSTGETTWERPPYFPHPPPPPRVLPSPPTSQDQQLVAATQQFQTQCNQPQLMHAGLPSVRAQQVVHPAQAKHLELAPNNIPMATASSHNNMNMHLQMQSNYTQKYLSMHPASQLVEVISSNSHTSALPQQQQPALKSTIFNNTTVLPATTSTGMLLVPTVRAMIDAEYTQRGMIQQQQNHESVRGDESLPKLELENLTAGAIADLVNITKELKARNVDGGDFAPSGEGSSTSRIGEEDEADQYYVPLQPFSLPLSAIPPRIEPGRVDIRLHALHSKLGKIAFKIGRGKSE